MDHTSWLQLLKIVRFGTLLRNIPDDLMPTLTYYCVPVSLSQILKFNKLLGSTEECEQAHFKSGIFRYITCSRCNFRAPVMKLDDAFFCDNCVQEHRFLYDNIQKWMIDPRMHIGSDLDTGNVGALNDLCRSLDKNGFRKFNSSKLDYEYPRSLDFCERFCSLCSYSGKIHRCVMCETHKDLIKVYHWKRDNCCQSKIIMLHICRGCLPKTNDDPSFGKEITHILLKK